MVPVASPSSWDSYTKPPPNANPQGLEPAMTERCEAQSL
jgi:hypothetical protein